MKDWILNDVLKTLRAENAIVNKKLKDEVSSAIANMNGQHSGTLVPCFQSHIHVHFCTIRLCMKMLYCHNPNSTTTQLNLTKQKLGLTRKWLYTTTTTHHHPPPQTQCRQYPNCYWPDFDETLKVASWEHLEQIPLMMGTTY